MNTVTSAPLVSADQAETLPKIFYFPEFGQKYFEAASMSPELQDKFFQFLRNRRWGTCPSCPKDQKGLTYPERCVKTKNQLSHGVDFNSLLDQYNDYKRQTTVSV